MSAYENDDAWVADVLGFWFVELGRKAWFSKDANVDAALKERFLLLHEVLSTWPVTDALSSADRALATVIVLDQFSRNLFRDSPKAFATDERALAIARLAIERGLDMQVPPERRVFFYLLFEHSENAADQARAVELIATIGDAEFDRYARAHKAVIDRFGRFPHRNVVLGRTTTPEEAAFLLEPGSSF